MELYKEAYAFESLLQRRTVSGSRHGLRKKLVFGIDCADSGPADANSDKTRTAQFPKRRPFRYNPLHDLESLWWIAVYFLVKKDALVDENYCAPSHPEKTHKWSKTLFIDRKKRNHFLSSNYECAHLSNCVAPQLASALRHLDDMRQDLIQAYHIAEDLSRPEVTIDAADCGLYEGMGLIFEKISQESNASQISLAPRKEEGETTLSTASVLSNVSNDDTRVASQSRKRSRDDESDGQPAGFVAQKGKRRKA